MKLYSNDENYKLYNGNMLDMMEVIEPNSIDAIITDPPYELNFMNRKWDNTGIAFQKETWKKCYDALKPGGHLLAFGGSRTFHRIACAIEDAGFEIRDTIMWLYGSGFPKSMNIGLAIDKRNGVESKVIGIGKLGKEETHTSSLNLVKGGFGGEFEIKKAQNEWGEWGTQLKPSYEPIIVCRKPCEGSIVDNVMKYGVGGINIDECRVPLENGEDNSCGRFPANTILTYDETDFDEVCGGFPNTKSNASDSNYDKSTSNIYGFAKSGTIKSGVHFDDEGSASRYFYCAKASKRDRDEGLNEFEDYVLPKNGSEKRFTVGGSKEVSLPRKNIHPTVKPTSLIQYLVRLITPKGGTVLDPFNGSGSTGKACMYENADRNANYKYIGIELTEDYLPISKARIEFAEKNPVMDYMESVKTEEPKSKNMLF